MFAFYQQINYCSMLEVRDLFLITPNVIDMTV